LYSIDQGIADDPKIVAVARRLQIAVIGGNAASGLAVDGVRRDAGTLRRVLVVVPAIAEAKSCLAQRTVDVSPIWYRRAIDRNRTRVAVPPRVRKILVGLELAEIRQHRLPSPALAAPRFPTIEIVRHCADRDLAVDGGAAAH